MDTYPIKELAAPYAKLAQCERTVANELPQELSRLPEQSGLQGGESASRGGGRKKHGRTMKAASVPKTRPRVVSPTSGFTDDGHPTILAASRGMIQPSR